ncbi:MAG: hypothetical protein ACOYS2_00025, partial [Patescibacteria group bacterium]
MEFNYFLIPVLVVSGVATLLSGAWLIARSFLVFRGQLNRSLNMDLEIIRVTKPPINPEREGKKSNEQWREEIGAMEQLLSALNSLREKRGFMYKFLYDEPAISFEIANSSHSEEIIFFVAFPKKSREVI